METHGRGRGKGGEEEGGKGGGNYTQRITDGTISLSFFSPSPAHYLALFVFDLLAGHENVKEPQIQQENFVLRGSLHHFTDILWNRQTHTHTHRFINSTSTVRDRSIQFLLAAPTGASLG